MLQQIEGLPAGIEGFKAEGKVTKEDYAKTLQPLIEHTGDTDQSFRLLFQFGPEFDGFTVGGAWEDAKLGLKSLPQLEGCAIVSDIGWIRQTSRIVGFLVPCPVRVFGNEERGEAVMWLTGLPGSLGVSHRLIPSSRVIVVEVGGPLRSEDFDAVTKTADAWLEKQHELNGLVIHGEQFPGWEDIGSFFRHVQFVRDHHRKIGRVALAVDSELADLAPRLAEHFVEAEIKRFGYEEVDNAIAWAADRNAVLLTPPLEERAGR